LGGCPEFAAEEPREVFAAYAEFMRSDNYAGILQCFAPELRPHVCPALLEKVQLDRKIRALERELCVHHGPQAVDRFRAGPLRRIETPFRRALLWRREDIDFSEATYVRRGEAVVAEVDGVAFGLAAIQCGDRWCLTPFRPSGWPDEMRMLKHVLGEFGKSADQVRQDVVAGRTNTPVLQEVLSQPDR
jgi:hypothetical protein